MSKSLVNKTKMKLNSRNKNRQYTRKMKGGTDPPLYNRLNLPQNANPPYKSNKSNTSQYVQMKLNPELNPELNPDSSLYTFVNNPSELSIKNTFSVKNTDFNNAVEAIKIFYIGLLQKNDHNNFKLEFENFINQNENIIKLLKYKYTSFLLFIDDLIKIEKKYIISKMNNIISDEKIIEYFYPTKYYECFVMGEKTAIPIGLDKYYNQKNLKMKHPYEIFLSFLIKELNIEINEWSNIIKGTETNNKGVLHAINYQNTTPILTESNV